MSKQKTIFICSECAYQTIKWLGVCPGCSTWGTLVESVTIVPLTEKSIKTVTTKPQLLGTTPKKEHSLLVSGIGEFDRVMGGGIMPGSLTIITGDPGIGKSTLLMHIGNAIALNHTALYVSTEESLSQIRQRAERLNCVDSPLLFSDNPHLENIIALADEYKPVLIIIDSIQNCCITAHDQLNTIGQLRDITLQLVRIAKSKNIAIIITGHITKEGNIAGPKTLEHMVDAVFYLQAEDQWQTRILRAVKNRFGTLDEIGFFQMGPQGLEEVTNINQQLISGTTYSPGSILVSSLEGSRPLLLELQALTVENKFGIPQRVVTGLNHKQVMLIAAILQKYLAIPLNTHEIFVKISGGFSIKGSTCDLGIALALLSSYFQQPVPAHSLALGEISLTGHIKPINHINAFIKESQKFGITIILAAKDQKISGSTVTRTFGHVYELVSLFA